ncbi:hypothetical protein EYF80_019378 [Liparis tanakae]|uniref:Uncharacterized protein n=1 Tax=Liparis tanakae TaxID=230148 RepID=A0A4Z2HZH4_9TELE|nr:hypothetical protein EYF80_019378 [Liparis tanakae]
MAGKRAYDCFTVSIEARKEEMLTTAALLVDIPGIPLAFAAARSAGFLQGAFSQHACVVNQQVETPCPDLEAHLLGTLFDATQMSAVLRIEPVAL